MVLTLSVSTQTPINENEVEKEKETTNTKPFAIVSRPSSPLPVCEPNSQNPVDAMLAPSHHRFIFGFSDHLFYLLLCGKPEQRWPSSACVRIGETRAVPKTDPASDFSGKVGHATFFDIYLPFGHRSGLATACAWMAPLNKWNHQIYNTLFCLESSSWNISLLCTMVFLFVYFHNTILCIDGETEWSSFGLW